MNLFVKPIVFSRVPAVVNVQGHLISSGNVYEYLNVLVRMTRKLIRLHQFRQVEKCMQLADHLYGVDNALIKNAVENTFVHAFTLMRQACNAVEWRFVQSRIPVRLYTVYIKQVTGHDQ